MRQILSLVAVVTSIALVPAANAAGVSAGTVISNTATAEYTDSSGQAKTLNSNTVDITVAELINVAVASTGSASSTSTPGEFVVPFEVTNIGNGPERFNLTIDPAVAGNDFNTTITQIVVDDGDGIYEPGVDQILAAPLATAELPAGASVTLFVIAQLPTGALDQQTSAVQLAALSVTGTGTAGTVVTGAGHDGTDAVIGTTMGTARASGSLQAGVATVKLVKSATVSDPFGGQSLVPGARVTYTLLAEITGNGSVTRLAIADTIPDGTTYQPGTLTLGGGSLSDADDGDAGHADSTGIKVIVGSATAGANQAVTFAVIVN